MMTQEELSFLAALTKRLPVEKMKISNHFLLKNSISINPWDIKRVLASENLEELIVEFSKRFSSDDEYTQRILVRDKNEFVVQFENRYGETFQAPGNLCFVIDLTTWTLITAYWNKSDDSHSSIDLSYYNPNLQIAK